MEKRLSRGSAIGLWIAAILLVISIFLPWWGMKFIAPQYPEGLDIIVYPYKLEGRIDIVNGLNHYIGMSEFSEETFTELRFLPYLIGALALFTACVAYLRKPKWLYALAGILVAGGAAGLFDIHRWLVNYGTNLDPKAPIKIEPFTPPILGENTIANFVTHSYFDYGALLLGIAAILIFLPLWRDRSR